MTRSIPESLDPQRFEAHAELFDKLSKLRTMLGMLHSNGFEHFLEHWKIHQKSRTQVETVAISFDDFCTATRASIPFKNLNIQARLSEQKCSGETTRACTDNGHS